MANSRSARKRIRSSEAKHQRNKAIRSAVRTRIGQARRALLGEVDTDAQQQVRAAVSALDRAAEKGVLHRNNAARRKSRLTALASRLSRAGAEDQAEVRAAATGGQKGKSRAPARAGASTTTRAKASKAGATTSARKTVRK